MEVKLYTFAKKDDSTARPSGTGTAKTCVLKDASGILAPTIRLDPSIGNPRSYNYAYISDFGRYYFIREWTYYRGEWEAALAVDVLASWKTEIGNTSAYILRATGDSAWSPWVVDNKYPMIAASETLGSDFADPWTGECIVLGVIGDSSHGNNRGAVNYYALTAAQAKTFFQFLMGNTGGYMDALDALFSYTFDEVFRASFDPMQYVVSARWYPFNVTNYTAQTALVVGKLPISVSPGIADLKMLPPVPIQSIGPLTCSIPVHPQVATRGSYLMAPPYSRYVLEFQPFGRIEINGSLLANQNTLECTVFCDIITGKAQLNVRAYNSGGGTSNYIGSFQGSLGSDVQIAQLTTNFFQNVYNKAQDAIISAATENYFGIATAAIGTVVDTRYQLSSAGSDGSMLPYVLAYPRLELHYNRVVDADNVHFGRPCCKVATISSFPGYIICAEGDVAAGATQEELETIRAHLTSGFYYE